MYRGVMLAVIVVLSSVAGVGFASAAGNEPPLPAAGLDQEIKQGQTVYLDAGGSVDPDGTIVEYEWTITTPNGTTTTPDCRRCVRTQFRATHSGTYNVTVTVTDDDGASRTDTLVVTANTVEPPTVTLTGPDSVRTGTNATFEADVTAGDADLAWVRWDRNGTELAQHAIDGGGAHVTLNDSFSSAGSRSVTVTAIDRFGRRADSNRVVEVTSPPVSPSPSPSPIPSVTGNSGSDRADRSLVRKGGEPYRIALSSDGVVRGGQRDSGVIFDADEVRHLRSYPGVSVKESQERFNVKTEQIVITNSELKEDIDKDAGQRGFGFKDAELDYVDPDKPSYDQESDDNTVHTRFKQDRDTSSRDVDTSTLSASTDNSDERLDNRTPDDSDNGDSSSMTDISNIISTAVSINSGSNSNSGGDETSSSSDTDELHDVPSFSGHGIL